MTLDKIPVGEICGVTGMDLPRPWPDPGDPGAGIGEEERRTDPEGPGDPLCRGAGHHPENRGGLRWENN